VWLGPGGHWAMGIRQGWKMAPKKNLGFLGFFKKPKKPRFFKKTKKPEKFRF